MSLSKTYLSTWKCKCLVALKMANVIFETITFLRPQTYVGNQLTFTIRNAMQGFLILIK